MPPRGKGAKGGSRPPATNPLALYKRALALKRSWCPLTTTTTDAQSLTLLASAAQQLQQLLGYAPAPAAEQQLVANDPDANAAAAAAPAALGHAPSDPPELAATWPLVADLAPGMRLYKAAVVHSLNLEMGDEEDDPEEAAFLLSAVHLELGRLAGRMWPRREGLEAEHLDSALALFPDYVAGAHARAQSLLARADSPDDLAGAERLLSSAVRAAERLWGGQPADAGAEQAEGGGEAGGSLSLVEANAACRREWECGLEARKALAMLLCQEGRDAEAAAHLTVLEYTHRLAREVLHYPLDPALSSGTQPAEPTLAAPGTYERYVRAVDSALPPALLDLLRGALAPDSRYWREHAYGRVGYFSYMHALDTPNASAVHQAAELLRRAAVERFPEVAHAQYAEWWAHCRRHPSGHQLHFDSDDEGVGGVRNPIISTVIYLTGGVGGPTLVTPQVLGGPLATHGWLVHPREGRVAMFDATFLHGVIPGRGPSPRPGEHRITLMVAFWRDIKCRPREDELPGPSQPFPGTSTAAISGTANESGGPEAAPNPSAASRYSWMADVPAHPDGPDGWGAAQPRDAVPVAVGRVWERLDGTSAVPGAVAYDACFQGF